MGGRRWAFFSIAAAALTAGALMVAQEPMALPIISPRDADPHAAGGPLPKLRHGGAFDARRSRSGYENRFIICMSLALFCAAGCEHGLATWLSPFGTDVGGLSQSRMAFLGAVYWAAMFGGRLVWTLISGIVRSSWPMLFFDISSTLFSSGLLLILGVVRTSQFGCAARALRPAPRHRPPPPLLSITVHRVCACAAALAARY